MYKCESWDARFWIRIPKSQSRIPHFESILEFGIQHSTPESQIPAPATMTFGTRTSESRTLSPPRTPPLEKSSRTKIKRPSPRKCFPSSASLPRDKIGNPSVGRECGLKKCRFANNVGVKKQRTTRACSQLLSEERVLSKKCTLSTNHYFLRHRSDGESPHPRRSVVLENTSLAGAVFSGQSLH